MRVQFPLPALLYHGVIAMAASKAHNLEVGGSSPPPVTKLIYMEEIEKSKMTRTKKSNDGTEVHQIMTAIYSTTLRGIVNASNELGVKREDIVSLLKENGQFVLVYFK